MDKKYNFEQLLAIVEKLRMPDGCPWDREQTHDSIKHNIIEEGYELIEALESGDADKMADESGDLLLQVIFHAQIAKEAGEYDIDDCINKICEKLIHRHPHVFGDTKLSTSEEVLEKWNKIKRDDRGQDTIAKELAGVSNALPSLMRAEKVQKKAEKNGYVFQRPSALADSVAGMLRVLENTADKEIAEKYIGKMIFELICAATGLGVEPELALNKHIDLFIKEFEKFEQVKTQ